MGACAQFDDGDSRRVLVVDDDPEVVDLTEIFLKREGMTVVGETDPEVALARFEPELFDVVVCDYRMPEMTGVEFCRRVRETGDVPCVIFTSADDPEVRMAVEQAGFGLVYKRGTEGYDRLADHIEKRDRQRIVA